MFHIIVISIIKCQLLILTARRLKISIYTPLKISGFQIRSQILLRLYMKACILKKLFWKLSSSSLKFFSEQKTLWSPDDASISSSYKKMIIQITHFITVT